MPKPAILTKALRGLRHDPQATRSYEMMSGAFVWSDERPADYCDVEADYAFRFLIGYRASLVRGEPREELRSIWEAVSEACPEWPGFRPERCSTDLAGDLDDASNRMVRRIDAL